MAKYLGEDYYDKAIDYAHQLNEQSLASIMETKAILKSFNADALSAARDLETKAMKRLYGSEDNIKAIEKFFFKKRINLCHLIKFNFFLESNPEYAWFSSILIWLHGIYDYHRQFYA